MRNAQEVALVQIACQRGLLSQDALALVRGFESSGPGSLPQLLLQRRLVAPDALQAILRELAATPFVCASCAATASFAQLHALPSLSCPRCGHALEPRAAEQLATQAYRQSGSHLVAPLHDSTVPQLDSQKLSLVGRTVGSYAIERELGRGSNGIVYLAQRPGLSRRFALKVLRSRSQEETETIKRFLREADLASKLNDPALISVYDVGQDGELYFYAMEYCPGETLQQRLRRGPLGAIEGSKMIRELARAMHSAHELGVIHRDLKPANIIMSESDGRPRVTDFGLARGQELRSSLTKTGDIIGTPAYMAPEQFVGEAIDRRVDVYALGGILFEVVSGHRAFTATSARGMAEQVLVGDPRRLRQVDASLPVELERICAKALAREVRDRYATAAELRSALHEFLARFESGSGVLEAPLAAGAPPIPSRVPVTAVWAALALALLALLVTGVAVLRSASSAPAPAPRGPDLEQLLSHAATLAEGGVAAEKPLLELLAQAEGIVTDDPEATTRLVEAREAMAESVIATGRRADGSADPAALELAGQIAPVGGETATRLAEEATRALEEDLLRAALLEARKLGGEARSFDEVAGILDDLRPQLTDSHLLDRLALERLRLGQRRGQFQAVVDDVDRLQLPGELGLEAKLLKGLSLYRIPGETSAAIITLQEVYEAQPEGAIGLTARANALLYGDSRPRGAEVARQALALDPGQVDALIALGFCVRGPERVEAFEEAIELAPEHWRAHWGFATATVDVDRDRQRAFDAFQLVVDLTAPQSYLPAWLYQTRMLMAGDQYDLAVAICDEILRVYPARGEVYLMRAIANGRDGFVEEATADYRKMLEVDRDGAALYLQGIPSHYAESDRIIRGWLEKGY